MGKYTDLPTQWMDNLLEPCAAVTTKDSLCLCLLVSFIALPLVLREAKRDFMK